MIESANENTINITDLDQKIYRIYPLLRAIDLFSDNKNALIKPHMWDDPFENFFLAAKVFDGSDEVDISSVQQSWFGQCWTTVPESDAMWRIYSPNKDSVRISSTIRKVFSSIYDVTDPYAALSQFIGRVEYAEIDQITSICKTMNFRDLAHGGGNRDFAKTLLIKRKEFEHEHEVRLLYSDVAGKYRSANHVLFDFDTLSLVEEVMFDPRLDMRIVAAYSDLITSNGFKGDVSRSHFYDAPKLIISL